MAAARSVRQCKGTIWLVVVMACCAMQPGCVRRRLTIRSSPAGALVSINNQEIGPTPVSVAFLYYGVYSIRVEKSGYESETVNKKISPPFYEYPVVDFFSENVWPWELRDERIVDFQLRPQVIIPDDQLLRNAEDLRGNAQRGFFTPLAPPQTAPPNAAPYGAAPYSTHPSAVNPPAAPQNPVFAPRY